MFDIWVLPLSIYHVSIKRAILSAGCKTGRQDGVGSLSHRLDGVLFRCDFGSHLLDVIYVIQSRECLDNFRVSFIFFEFRTANGNRNGINAQT